MANPLTNITVSVPKRKLINVTVETKNGIISSPTSGNVSVTTSAVASPTLLMQLQDVVLTTPTPESGQTLVYNEENDKYEIRFLDIDGGNF
jgi:hypothetical protein